MTLLTLLTFTSGFSAQLPVSHKHMPGSSHFGPLLETTFWLIQHCCLTDHPDQVLEADASTGDLSALSDWTDPGPQACWVRILPRGYSPTPSLNIFSSSPPPSTVWHWSYVSLKLSLAFQSHLTHEVLTLCHKSSFGEQLRTLREHCCLWGVGSLSGFLENSLILSPLISSLLLDCHGALSFWVHWENRRDSYSSSCLQSRHFESKDRLRFLVCFLLL